MKKMYDNAVSPVVAIMLMLVVTIIIAAVVSGFAGSAVTGQKKAPQALVNGKFSILNGMEITHAGGDALATKDLVFTIKNGKTFGPNLEQTTAQIVNKSYISDTTGQFLLENYDGSSAIPSFKSGDTLFISNNNCTCNVLQTRVAPQPWSPIAPDGYTYQGTQKAALFNLCYRNANSIGKTFTLEVSDKSSGALISRSDIVIGS
jgi:hypothetical protein